MARQGGMIKPTSQSFGLGFGCFIVYENMVELEVSRENPPEPKDLVTHNIDPELAPLFRMIANRLDELAGKRPKRVLP